MLRSFDSTTSPTSNSALHANTTDIHVDPAKSLKSHAQAREANACEPRCFTGLV
jgi:hypothetical protein